MRKIAKRSIAVALALILGPTAIAQVPRRDSVNGSRNVRPVGPSPGILSVIDARSRALGRESDRPGRDHDRNHLGRTTFHGDVTCLTVTGNTAVLSGPIPTPCEPRCRLRPRSEDNAGAPQPDQVAVAVMLNSTPPSSGSVPRRLRRPHPAADWRDFTVHDAHPLPTAKDQCKHGGCDLRGLQESGDSCEVRREPRRKSPDRAVTPESAASGLPQDLAYLALSGRRMPAVRRVHHALTSP